MARLICTICTVLFCRINPNRLGTGSPSSATDCPDYPIIRPTIHHALRQVVDIKNRDGTLVEIRRDYQARLWRREMPLSSIFGQGRRHPCHDVLSTVGVPMLIYSRYGNPTLGDDILYAGKLASYKTQSLPLWAGRGRTAICVGPERGHTGNSGPGRYARCG